MKLFTAKFAPNPRRVEIYLKEKPIPGVEQIMVDLRKGEHRTPEFKRKNPLSLLPVLELADGSVLTESLAICQYFEELHPTPTLVGNDPWQRALTCEAIRLAELGLLLGAMTAYQHTSPFFARRISQREHTATEGQEQFARYLSRIEHLLSDRQWLAGPLFTLADITAICAIDFGRFGGCALPNDLPTALPNVVRWLAQVRERPSCKR